MFKKAAVFTDIHFGLKSNSRVHNDDCEEFVDWFIEQAQANGCETGIFCGDWHHNRNSLNLTTMDATIRSLEKLGSAFEQFFFFDGNHDLYYKDKRDINSTAFSKYIPGITFVDEITTIDDVTLVPWLVGDEWKQVSKIKSKYIFGHFELPSFYMNALVKMPDHGDLRAEHFKHQEYVFSGHFHKRQYKNNIHYIGNAFPHNYADVDDDERGAMFLEWGGEPQYVNWTECPKYKVFNLRRLLDDHSTLLDEYTYARVKLDISISYEEANFIREKFAEQYNVRELQLVPIKEEEEYEGGEITFESVNQIVLAQLDTIESNTIQKDVLINIYNSIDTE